MDLAMHTMLSTIGHSVVAGAITMIAFVGIVGYMKYSAGKDRTRSGYNRI